MNASSTPSRREITLPTGDIFAEGPPVKGKKPLPGAKKAEPPKPAGPSLAPPRLVKTAKPAAHAEEAVEAAAPAPPVPGAALIPGFELPGVLDVPELPLPQPAAVSAAAAIVAIPTSLLRACLPTTSSSAGTPMLRLAKTRAEHLVNNLGAIMFACFC